MATLGQAPSTLPASSTSTPAAGARMLAATPTARSSLYTLHEVQLENGTSVTVDAGPAGTGYNVNRLYTDVTICYPGSTTQCQTINHVLVDTGSTGLRLCRVRWHPP